MVNENSINHLQRSEVELVALSTEVPRWIPFGFKWRMSFVKIAFAHFFLSTCLRLFSDVSERLLFLVEVFLRSVFLPVI